MQPNPPAREGAETRIKFIDTIPSTNCAEWRCAECGAIIVSSSRPTCLRCAVILAAQEWAQASHALEQADAAVGAGGVSEYARLSQIAGKAFEDEQDKMTALRAAVDALKENAG